MKSIKAIQCRFAKLSAVTVLAVLAACATTPAANPLVGHWDLTTQSPRGESKMALTVASDLSGTISSESMGGSVPIRDAHVKDGEVGFAATFSTMGMEIPATFSGAVAGDKLTGKLATQFGDFSVAGIRSVAK